MLTVSAEVSISSNSCGVSGGGSSGSGGFFGLAFFVSRSSSFLIRTKSTNLPSYLDEIAPLPVAIRICMTHKMAKVVNTEMSAATAIRVKGSSILILPLVCSDISAIIQ